MLTTSRGGELHQAERSVVSRHRFEGDVTVPLSAALLLRTKRLRHRLGVELLVLNGADGADFEIVATQLPLRVENRVDVEARGRRPSGELSEPQNQLLLELVGQVVLGTEENDTALGYYWLSVGVMSTEDREMFRGLLVMAKSLMSSSALGALSHSTSLAVGNSRPMTGVTSKDSYASSTPDC